MAQEIERKFLVDIAKWQALEKPAGALYRQGYLSTDPAKTIRVRLSDDSAYLTIKGANHGMSRLEYEYGIPIADARELLAGFSTNELSKTRYKIPFVGKVWEVDVFHGDNEGLIVAEIELASEHEEFEVPHWIGEEVTGIERYYNSNIAITPFKNW